jgi:hypothetical protein
LLGCLYKPSNSSVLHDDGVVTPREGGEHMADVEKQKAQLVNKSGFASWFTLDNAKIIYVLSAAVRNFADFILHNCN